MKTLSKKFGILAAGLLMLAVSGCAEMDPSEPALDSEQEQAMIEAEWEEWKAAFAVAKGEDGTSQTDDGEGESDDTVWPDPFDPDSNP